MEHFKLFIISGKARHGKTTLANMIKEYYKEKSEDSIITSYAKYIKMYAREITDWDGNEETKPRELLQALGILIRTHLNIPNILIDRIREDIKLYEIFFKYIIIDDARLPEEIDYFKRIYPNNVVTIHIERPNYINDLSEEENMHYTEQMLDNYADYDYTIINDGTLDNLKEKVRKLLGGID